MNIYVRVRLCVYIGFIDLALNASQHTQVGIYISSCFADTQILLYLYRNHERLKARQIIPKFTLN